MGVLAVEMETAALYMNAAASGKRALAILTISDSLATGEACTPQERQETFLDMMGGRTGDCLTVPAHRKT